MEKTKSKKSVVKIIAGSVAFIVVMLAVLWGIGYSTGIIQKNITAVKVGDYKVNALEYRYYYTDAKANLISQFGEQMTANGTDLNKPLEKQNYTPDETWEEYLSKATVSELTEVYAFYQAGKAAGYEIDEGIQVMIDAQMSALETAAAEQGKDVDTLVKSIYGKNLNKELLTSYISNRYYAIGYVRSLQETFSVTDDEIKAYYEENPNEFDVLDYNIFAFPFETVDGDEAKTTENKDAAKAKAEEMLAKITDSASFANLAHEYAPEDKKPYYADKAVTFIKGGAIAKDAGPIADWTSDAARVKGDKAVIEGTKEYTVVLFDSRYLEKYNAKSVRHILISPETAETHQHVGDTPHSDDEFDGDAKKKAEDLLAKYMAGERTAENFGKLAEENTDDGGSISTGGLYENFGKNQMYEVFEDWSYNPANKPGDTGIIKSEAGYHIMYFVGDGPEYWTVKAEEIMSNNFFDEMFEKTVADIESSQNKLAMSMAY